MQNGGSNESSTRAGGHSGDGDDDVPDIEKQEQPGNTAVVVPSVEDGEQSSLQDSANDAWGVLLTIVVSNGESCMNSEPAEKLSKTVDSTEEGLANVSSLKKDYLSRTTSSHEQCRVCQQEKEEVLIELGCRCLGGLAKAHRSCIETWFRIRGSNKCEICQEVASNVAPLESQTTRANSWVWRFDPNVRGFTVSQERERGCFSPLWVAFVILIGGLLLDVLISITLGVSALPVNIIIGVIVVLGLGTALRLALEFCHEWSLRRAVQRVETNVNLGYHPTL